MDFSLMEKMMFGASQVNEYLNKESLDRVFGDGKILVQPKKAKKLKGDDFVAYEKLLVEDTTENLYKLIATNQVFFAKAISNRELRSPNGVKGYAFNAQKVYDSLVEFESEVDKAVEMGLDNHYILFRDEQIRKDFKDFMVFLKELMPYFEQATEIERVCKKSGSVSREFFDRIPELNKGVRNTLTSSLPYVGHSNELGDAFLETYMTIMKHFDSNSKYVDSQKEVFETKWAIEEEVAKQRAQNSKPPEMSEAEKERRKCIKEANDLYDELCLDFMRDLEKQYSASTKDMYEHFVNVKFKKFVERFNMPLSNDVSVGQAKEACGQIKNLMDYVSKISQNAYTISVYSEKQ
ncbi:MAG: hypothetical protein IKJ33_05075 [Clostridia bacterium]|nr:hypothetical protein [Clostridia bacterium]